MKKTTLLTLLLLLSVLLAACGTSPQAGESAQPQDASATQQPEAMMGPGHGKGMMARHHAQVPAEYDALSAPQVDAAGLQAGGELYALHCASCHGDGGMGDGPAGKVLDPQASPIAQTSQMLGDNYLFWRISEGGAGFETAMPAWKASLSEAQRWELIAYTRALGRGEVEPQQSVGGADPDPSLERANQEAMLNAALVQKLITQADADNFTLVHALLDEALAETTGATGSMDERQAAALAALIAAGKITQAQSDQFNQTHDVLVENDLMH